MAEYTWKDYARALALAESLVDVASEEPPPSDAALRDEVCMARAVVAADIIIERLELELAAARKTREFQSRVKVWMLTCLGPEVAADSRERNYRFLEEALELVQACGCTREDAVKLVDYVFARPIGVVSQEVGGVVVTLAALCSTRGEDFVSAAEAELSRISTPEMVQKIRAKHASKTIRGPLPGELAAYRATQTKELRDE